MGWSHGSTTLVRQLRAGAVRVFRPDPLWPMPQLPAGWDRQPMGSDGVG